MAAADDRAVRVAVDLHCHVLPGLDDGARDLADAVAMAGQAEADGIGAICATPHIRADHDVRIDELPSRIAAVAAAVGAAGCRTRILGGGEVAVDVVAALSDQELAEVSLGGARRWILLEPDSGPLDDRLERAVDALHARGFRALVAHPERHVGADLIARLARLVGRGALVQVTAASLIEETTRPGMLTLADAGVVHVLGSDAHSARAGRPVALAAAVHALADVERVAAHLDWIARTAPRAIVLGDELTSPFPARQP